MVEPITSNEPPFWQRCSSYLRCCCTFDFQIFLSRRKATLVLPITGSRFTLVTPCVDDTAMICMWSLPRLSPLRLPTRWIQFKDLALTILLFSLCCMFRLPIDKISCLPRTQKGLPILSRIWWSVCECETKTVCDVQVKAFRRIQFRFCVHFWIIPRASRTRNAPTNTCVSLQPPVWTPKAQPVI